MNPLFVAMGLGALVWIAIFALYIVALRRRALARFEHGHLYSLLIALVGVALMSSTIVGTWGYQAAKALLDEEIVRGLSDIGEITEKSLNGDMRGIEQHLQNLGRSLVPLVEEKAPVASVRAELDLARRFNERFLDLHLFDEDGRAVADSSSGRYQRIDRQAIGASLDGRMFVSDAHKSSVTGKQVLLITVPIQRDKGPVLGVLATRFDLAAELAELVGSVEFNQSGYAVLVDGEGHIIAHPDASRLESDVSSYTAVQRAWQDKAAGSVNAPNAQGVDKLFVYRPVDNPATIKAERPWVILTEIDAAEQMAPLYKLRNELLVGIAILLVIGTAIAHQVSSSVTRPLHRLGEFAHQIGTGDLTARVDIAGRDVAGRLGTTLNEMVHGLQERDHVKEVFGRYIATQVSDQILKGTVDLGGEARVVSILFSDIRNFTGMSEQMSPEQVVSFLNDYFSEMVEAVFDHGGVLDKFIGDGLMAVFGSLGNDPDHPRNAVRAALRMKALLAKINGVRGVSGKPPIQIGIGIHTDQVIVGNIGSRRRLEYTVVGDGVNTSSRLQGLNKEFGTTILISETTYEHVKDEFECKQMPEAHLRGKTKDLRFYEVISMRTPAPVAAVAAV